MFLLNLTYDCLFILIVIVGIILIAYRIKNKKINRKYISLLIVLIIFLPILLFGRLIPKIKDFKYYNNGDYAKYEGYCQSQVKAHGRKVKIGNQVFSYNWKTFNPKIYSKYTIYYLPNSKYIMNYELG